MGTILAVPSCPPARAHDARVYAYAGGRPGNGRRQLLSIDQFFLQLATAVNQSDDKSHIRLPLPIWYSHMQSHPIGVFIVFPSSMLVLQC